MGVASYCGQQAVRLCGFNNKPLMLCAARGQQHHRLHISTASSRFPHHSVRTLGGLNSRLYTCRAIGP